MCFLHDRIEQLQGELQRLQIVERRRDARGGMFVLCDLDGFKAAQDAHPDGHAFGDRILREFAAFLVSITRVDEDEVSVRFGGDEFVVWVPDSAAAVRVIERLRDWKSGGITCTTGAGATMEGADSVLMAQKQIRRALSECAILSHSTDQEVACTH